MATNVWRICIWILGLKVLRTLSLSSHKFSTGWKIWPDTFFALFTCKWWTRLNFDYSLYFSQPFSTFLSGFTICPWADWYSSKSKIVSTSWITMHSCNHTFALQKFRQSWCFGQIFDCTRKKIWPRFWHSKFLVVTHLNFLMVRIVPCEIIWNFILCHVNMIIIILGLFM